MPLVNFNQILPQARKESRAVGAFNIANFETAKAVVAAAELEQQPVIIQVYQRLMDDPQIPALAAMMRNMAERATVPVAVHLDHGASLDQVRLAIRCGFSSVMFDGSHLPFEENCAQTAEAAKLAHEHDVSIEGEIGSIPPPGTKNADIPLADPSECEVFAARTSVDVLAVAVGTAHGYYKEQPEIAIELAREVARRVPIPLVLHGGSNTPHEKVCEVIRTGFAKVNVSTEYQHEFLKLLTRGLQELEGQFLPVDKVMAGPVVETVQVLRKFIRMFSQPDGTETSAAVSGAPPTPRSGV